MARLRIGELLVSAKFISQEQLDQSLEIPRKEGQRLGDLLVERGLVTETQLTQLLGQQLSVPWVSLSHIEFSRQLLNLVPREVAEKFGLVPIYVRRVRKQGDTLYVAMNDPTNDVALAEAATVAGLPVRPMIAGQSDIRNAIRLYYGGGSDVAPPTQVQAPDTHAEPPTQVQAPPLPSRATLQATSRASPPAAGVSLAPEELIDEEPEPPTEAHGISDMDQATLVSEGMSPLVKQAVLSASGDSPDAAPEIEAREISLPKPKREGSTALSGLTLLDGTMIQFPKRPVRSKSGARAALAAIAGDIGPGELAAALRSATRAENASAEETSTWEPAFAAIVALLTRKGLVADRELLEELRKLV